MNISNSVALNTRNDFVAVLALPAEKLAIRTQYDGYVLGITMVPAMLSLGYDSGKLRNEMVDDLRTGTQPAANRNNLLDKFDREVERFTLAQVTQAEIDSAMVLFQAFNVKPDHTPGAPINYTPAVTKGFTHTRATMSGKRAYRMLSGQSLPEVVRQHLKTFL